jgi:hypothetical protein
MKHLIFNRQENLCLLVNNRKGVKKEIVETIYKIVHRSNLRIDILLK